jgi:hypothetical protein
MVYLDCGCDSAALPAGFTAWMHVYVSGADSFPLASVSFLRYRIALVVFISLALLFIVFLTEPAVSKFWAAGLGTRPLRSVWHGLHLQFTKK